MNPDLSELISHYAAGPRCLADVVGELSEHQLDAIPVPNTWSIRQVVCHLVDADLEYCQRMKRVLVEDNPTVQELIPDDFANVLHYNSRDVSQELDLLAATRSHMAAILQATDIEDFQRTAVHSADGPMTLETLLERIAGHIDHHLSFINEKLKAMASGN